MRPLTDPGSTHSKRLIDCGDLPDAVLGLIAVNDLEQVLDFRHVKGGTRYDLLRQRRSGSTAFTEANLLRFLFRFGRGGWYCDPSLHQIFDPYFDLVGGDVLLLEPFQNKIRVDESPGGHRASLRGKGRQRIGEVV